MAGGRWAGVAMVAGLAVAGVVQGVWGQGTTAPATQPSAVSPPANSGSRLVTPGRLAGLPAVPARRALGMTIDELTVDNQPLEKVLNYLRETSGANMVVNWKALEAANVNRDTPITLTVSDIPLRKVLRLVLDQASPENPLVFPVDSNVISITSETEADKVLVTRVYIVDDLVMTNNNPSPPPVMDLQRVTANGTTSGGSTGSGGGNGGGGLFTTQQTTTATQEDTPQQRGNDLATLIKEVVRPNIWRDNGGTASIKYFNGKLIVTAPQSVQEAIGGPMAPEGGQRLGTF